MKKLIICFGILVALSALQAQLPPQPEKEAVVRFNKAEIEALYTLIDDSPTPGNVRKPLLQKLAMAYEATWPSRPANAPVKQDSSNKKKN